MCRWHTAFLRRIKLGLARRRDPKRFELAPNRSPAVVAATLGANKQRFSRDRELVFALAHQLALQTPGKYDSEISSEKAFEKLREGVLKTVSKGLALGPERHQEVVGLLDDWQSSRTKTLRRSVLSLGIVLTGAGLGGADLGALSPLGLAETEEYGARIAWYLGALIMGGLFAFEVSLHIDKTRRLASAAGIHEDLKTAQETYNQVQQVIASQGVSAERIILALHKSGAAGENALRARYRVVDEYVTLMRGAHTLGTVFNRLDHAAVLLFAAISVSALTPFWGITVG